jgi:hypothetical protein
VEYRLKAVPEGQPALNKAPDHPFWAKWHLSRIGVPLTDANVDLFVSRTSAAYLYWQWLWDRSRGAYKPRKDESAWIDSQLLLYLCDPNVKFVTLDGHFFGDRLQGTTQAHQIVSAKTLLADAGITWEPKVKPRSDERQSKRFEPSQTPPSPTPEVQ